MIRWCLLLAGAACGRFSFEPATDAAPGSDGASLDGPPPIAITARGEFVGDTSELRRTLQASASRTTLTFATWYRTSDIGAMPLCAGTNDAEQTFVWADDTPVPGRLTFQHTSDANTVVADVWPHHDVWIHIVVAVDTTQVAVEDRVRWWIDGVPQAVTTYSGNPIAQGQLLYLGDPAAVHTLGNKWNGGFDWIGSLAETYLIWDHALDASYFVTTVAPGAVRSIAYAGPVTPESVYFDYATPGVNGFAGQPDWIATAVSSSTTDLPY